MVFLNGHMETEIRRSEHRERGERKEMTLEEYQTAAWRTANHNLGDEQQLTCAAMGLAGESGEFTDRVKKIVFQGHPLTKRSARNWLKRLVTCSGTSPGSHCVESQYERHRPVEYRETLPQVSGGLQSRAEHGKSKLRAIIRPD